MTTLGLTLAVSMVLGLDKHLDTYQSRCVKNADDVYGREVRRHEFYLFKAYG